MSAPENQPPENQPRDRRDRFSCLPPTCRAFLCTFADNGTGAVDGTHAEQCAECAKQHSFQTRLGSLLSTRPISPELLRTTQFAEMLHERIIEAAASSSLGILVANRDSAPIHSSAWPEALLESEVARSTISATPQPSPAMWAEVRHSIMAGVSERRQPRRTVNRSRISIRYKNAQ